MPTIKWRALPCLYGLAFSIVLYQTMLCSAQQPMGTAPVMGTAPIAQPPTVPGGQAGIPVAGQPVIPGTGQQGVLPVGGAGAPAVACQPGVLPVGGSPGVPAVYGQPITNAPECACDPNNPNNPRDPNNPNGTRPRSWIDNLPYRPIPPLGNSVVLPTGPGYYSLLDCITDHYRDGPPKSPYPPYALMRNSFYDADFRYLDDPDYVSEDWFDRFHNIHAGDWLLGTGGQVSTRFMDQSSRGLTGKQDQFDLTRVRVYGDAWYQDIFRFYVETISASTTGQTLPPLRTDRDSFDFLNLFVGFKVFTLDDNPAYLRIGRQELLFGSERLVTPLEWANTRQTFQGVHGLWTNYKLDVDVWWAKPVLPNPDGISWVDDKQDFAGAWLTYHPNKQQIVDMYWLYLDNQNTTVSNKVHQDPINIHTLGFRYTRSIVDDYGLLWDLEPDFQIGQKGSQNAHSESVSAGLGYYFGNLPMTPTFWAYYDWASGSKDPNKGDYSTFNQLYGFGHYYLGFMDLIGRSNIRDWNAQVYLFPTKWININLQYHLLNLDRATDALYGANGLAERYDPKGTAGGEVGQELTSVCNFHLGPHSDILTGYSILFAGQFLKETATNAAQRANPQMLYVMYNFRW